LAVANISKISSAVMKAFLHRMLFLPLLLAHLKIYSLTKMYLLNDFSVVFVDLLLVVEIIVISVYHLLQFKQNLESCFGYRVLPSLVKQQDKELNYASLAELEQGVL